jgi:hypothetical protein
MPAPAPVAASAPSRPTIAPAPQVQEAQPATNVVVTEEKVLIAQNDAPAPMVQESDPRSPVDQTLPQTGGYSDLQLIAGLVILGGGIASVFASRGKSVA